MASELQKDSINEAKSDKRVKRNGLQKLFFGALLILFGVAAIYNGVSSLFDNTVRLLAPNGFIAAEVVDTGELRTKGLSGRDSLKDSEGMLFVFDDTSTEHCFWMKDMRFSIDMVWLSEQKEVVTVKSDVAPNTYPDKFCPDKPAKYVLEVGSGRAESLAITTGTKLRW